MKRYLQLLILLTSLCFYQKSYADTFIVTSNADSGPGTLREAITLANANGTAVKDFIIFAIAGMSRDDRTIIPSSEFPKLSSNLEIDGTTQNGTAIGQSDAKIILLINTKQTATFTFFKFENAVDIGIYGIFFFNDVFTIFSDGYPINGIDFTKSSNVIIGKAGKGNYFRGLQNAIQSKYTSEADVYITNVSDVTIQSNIFNNAEDGEPSIQYLDPSRMINPIEFAINFYNARNVKIGGASAAEGNTIMAQNIFLHSRLATGSGFVTIENNRMGVKTDGTISATYGYQIVLITIEGYDVLADYDIVILNNIINGNIRLIKISKFITIQGNQIFNGGGNGTSIDFTLRVLIQACTGGGLIGGDLPGQPNKIFTSGPMNYHSPNSNSFIGSIWVNSSPNFSITKNTTHCTGLYGSTIQTYRSSAPHVQIDSAGIGYVRGKATPNCKIEVFLDDECWACDGMILLGTTISNADSTWSFTGAFNAVVIATATDVNGSTSGYSEPTFSLENLVVTQPLCNQPNGSVKGIKILHSTDNFEWRTVFMRDGYVIDSLLSTENLDLLNVPEGDYYFVAKLGQTCRSYMQYFKLKNYTPKFDTTDLQKVNPSCGKFNGIIYNLKFTNPEYSKMVWINEQRQVLSTQMVGALDGLPEGKYKAIITDTTIGCADSTDWIELKNQTGPLLNTNNRQITTATCNNADGSITNITTSGISGNSFIQWLDSLENPVGNSLNLSNVPGGKYRLKFKDESGCDTIITPYFTVGRVGEITIDTNGKTVLPSSCTSNTGSIQNIKVTGATNYQWINTVTNAVAGNRLAATNLPPGTYQLTASNATGCSAVSPVITVPLSSFTPISVTTTISNDATCAENNGSILITGFTTNSSSYSFKWVNKTTSQVLGSGTTLNGLSAGTYLLMATDQNGCEKEIFSSTLKAFPKPSFDLSSIKIESDKCSLSEGGISGIKINGLSASASTYTWKDERNNTVSNTVSLQNVNAGSYYLTVTDGGSCTVQSNVFTITNNDNAGISPQYDETIIPRFTAATITVKNPQPGTYYLYSDAVGTQLLQQNNSGTFVTTSLSANTNFYIKHVNGTCSSGLALAKVTVVDKSFFAIPSAFTPNNDGKNDKLNLKVIGRIDVEYFKIFNRNGEEVFSTKMVNNGWNGVYKGSLQPSSVFVWVAKGKDLLGNVIEQRGTLVLIR